MPHPFKPDTEMPDLCATCGAGENDCKLSNTPVKPTAKAPVWCRLNPCPGMHGTDTLPHAPRGATKPVGRPLGSCSVCGNEHEPGLRARVNGKMQSVCDTCKGLTPAERAARVVQPAKKVGYQPTMPMLSDPILPGISTIKKSGSTLGSLWLVELVIQADNAEDADSIGYEAAISLPAAFVYRVRRARIEVNQ